MTRPVKTSATHPLAIPAVAAGKGRVGMAMCPGKRQPNAITGPWDRDLAVDMDAIAAFGAAVLITLMEEDELAGAVSAAELAAAAAARGIRWLQLPIVDLGVPDATFEARWRDEGRVIREALRAGQNVVVHCRGGRGRSGLLAARILIEMGMPREDAIVAVRAAHPPAIETPVQEAHVRASRPVLD